MTILGLGAALILGLSACNEMALTEGGKPYIAHMAQSTPILVEPIHGAAPEFAAHLAINVAEDLRAQGIEAVTEEPKQPYNVLRGKVFRQDSVNANGQEDILAYWELIDDRGQRIGTLAQNIEAPVGSWQRNDALLLKNLSRASAPELASLIAHDSGMGKPVVTGPQLASIHDDAMPRSPKLATTVKSLPPPAPTEAKLASADDTPSSLHIPASIQTAQAIIGNKSNGPTLAILPVTGAPMDGNGQIQKALMSYLEQTEIRIVNRANGPDLLLKGEVETEILKDGSSFVTVYWSLLDKDGKILGTIKQANGVPGKTIAKSWSEIAYPVAQAGTLRIIELYQQISVQLNTRRQG
ncbi:MAG: hypothetical protein R3E60_05940 [Alphaproteobacteria bacterium]